MYEFFLFFIKQFCCEKIYTKKMSKNIIVRAKIPNYVMTIFFEKERKNIGKSILPKPKNPKSFIRYMRDGKKREEILEKYPEAEIIYIERKTELDPGFVFSQSTKTRQNIFSIAAAIKWESLPKSEKEVYRKAYEEQKAINDKISELANDSIKSENEQEDMELENLELEENLAVDNGLATKITKEKTKRVRKQPYKKSKKSNMMIDCVN